MPRGLLPHATPPSPPPSPSSPMPRGLLPPLQACAALPSPRPAAHSDHEALAQQAEAARSDTMLKDLTQQLEERRARVQELRQYMDGQVTETQAMQVRGGRRHRAGEGKIWTIW